MNSTASPDVQRWRYAFAGVVSAGLFFGVAELASVPFTRASSPLVAVGAWFIDITPPWLKDFAIAAFGTNDKLALFISMGIVAILAAALLGILARRASAFAAGLIILLAIALGMAVWSRAATGIPDLVPTAAGAVAGILALNYTVRAAEATEGSASSNTAHDVPRSSRRQFLRAVSVTAAGAVLLGVGGRALSSVRNVASATREALRLPRATTPASAVPVGAQINVAGMPQHVTPNAEFYRIDTALRVPEIDPKNWRLRVHGMVEEDLDIDFAELLEQPLIESRVTLACVSNPVGGELIGNAKWLGYPIRELLARARPLPEADMVLSTSHDGFTASTPLEALTDDRDALLAVGMNDEPLPLEHGFPVRMVVPGLYGYVSATKWVIDLEVTRFDQALAYWSTRGWSTRGPIKLSSRIDVPRAKATVSPEKLAIAGTAWAQHTGISKVEVRLDDGPWQQAQLAEQDSVDTWRQFVLRVDSVAAGEHTATVRAYDREGKLQIEEPMSPAPNGATGWHRVSFTVK
ncbi:molybdopterin-dependent oxidoreductase [Glutamicibacter sp. PS]|uniref:molybdopterin-dependent oxidoreductase n=1 Tax=Glutamicibacter sp. PS TaxID=3075634 RepID=UPI0028504CEE|nr:molybdopterin-dependent oxidoreductase [Glutamicibacter sp. PS]MDR4533367.1 molybdopterin-dependent oxidoreductase [Glutamicibacter sp. PS]